MHARCFTVVGSDERQFGATVGGRVGPLSNTHAERDQHVRGTELPSMANFSGPDRHCSSTLQEITQVDFRTG